MTAEKKIIGNADLTGVKAEKLSREEIFSQTVYISFCAC